MIFRAMMLSLMTLSFLLLSCNSDKDALVDSCRVESAVGVSYCLNETARNDCLDHGESLDDETVTTSEVTDCREQGFTQYCEDLKIYVAVGDECDAVNEAWAIDGSEAAGGAGGAAAD